ncbi:MAG: lipopolysaccharide biosynthesis protein [Thermoguttaceae bacterium]|nr:lipopolysaccharide biosynthesis protein [Thermoguttaceae bacterium]MDW8037718.1 lipopolysaccharide biosynthesis protein [Thermoguttaceae bacterium]
MEVSEPCERLVWPGREAQVAGESEPNVSPPSVKTDFDPSLEPESEDRSSATEAPRSEVPRRLEAGGWEGEIQWAYCSGEAMLTDPPRAFPPDTVLRGVVILLVLAALQRLIGFVRAVCFCQYLPAEELGKWEILFSFLNLAAPLFIFSLPGTFGRYAERYRRRGQLRSFLQQTALVCAGLTIVAGLAIFGTKDWLNRLLFGKASADQLLTLLPWTLASVIGVNYLTELFTALRNAWVSALLFFVNSVLFALVGIGCLALWRNDALAVTAAYGLANLLTAVLAFGRLRRNYVLLPPDSDRLPTGELWPRLLRFAFSVWIINLATNLFSIVDRYLIVHLASGDPDEALALVGQYHSGRLLPLLLLSILQMLGTMILPYMSADWEMGQTQRAGCRLRVSLKLLAPGMTALGAFVIICSPLLFHTALGDKFPEGQRILPGTLCYCIWFGLAMVAQNYLWCAEKTYLATLTLGIGLGTNICLNIWMVPRWGLPGVVMGTTLAHLVVLGMTLLAAGRLGFQTDKSLFILLLLPAGLFLGPIGAALLLLGVLLAGVFSGSLWSVEERKLLQEGWQRIGFRWAWFAERDRTTPRQEMLP